MSSNQRDDLPREGGVGDDIRTGEAIAHVLAELTAAGAAPEFDKAPPQVRRQIRRRRAAKSAGIGAGTLALVGVLAVGAWAAPWRAESAPGPAGTPTPSPSPSPDASPSPEPTSPTPGEPMQAADDARFAAGRPWWPDSLSTEPASNSWFCGAAIDDVLSSTTNEDLALTIVGDVDVTDPHEPWAQVLVTAGTQGLPETYSAGDIRLVWTQDGVVVDGATWREGGGKFVYLWFPDDEALPEAVESMAPGASIETRGANPAGWGCGTLRDVEEQPIGEFPDTLPPGTYEVYAYTYYFMETSTEDSSAKRYVASDPVTVTVP